MPPRALKESGAGQRWKAMTAVEGRSKWKLVDEKTTPVETAQTDIRSSAPKFTFIDPPATDDYSDSNPIPIDPGRSRPRLRKTQSDYMRDWIANKQTIFIKELLKHNSGPQGTDIACPVCQGGRGVWRCMDCADHRPTCALCCRTRHHIDYFHRIEKWNGRFYQAAGLWQVGVKIFTGHDGRPCVMRTDYNDHDRGVEVHTRNSGELTLLQDRRKLAEAEATALQASTDRIMSALEHADTDPLSSEHLHIVDNVAFEEDDNWEDEDDYIGPKVVPRLYPRHPPHDGAGNTFVTVAHTNGYHSLPVVWCMCPAHLEDRDLQMLRLGLYPATYDNIKTVMSFSLLEHQRLDNLECKTSIYQYHQKLRRLTCPDCPNTAPNRYAEFRRISRQWRNMKYRIWFQVWEDREMKQGEMGLFCAACPQPGVNLPSDWKEDQAQYPSSYQRSLVADGNFKADHVKQKHEDVWLTNGEGFMTGIGPYEDYQSTAVDKTQKPSCHRHRAQLNVNAMRSAADCTGVGGHACARHGCFAPGSLVNFRKGERQIDMDWSLCQALATTNVGDLPDVLHIYDIACQYFCYLSDRINANPALHVPPNINLIHAIGLFHVHGHKDECLYRWATTYVPGAGLVDGEVLETLWSVLNKISASTRTASLAHRTEILDDHMADNNFKKITNIDRYNRALVEVTESRRAFESLDMAAPVVEKAVWLQEILEAEAKRSYDFKAMDIMLSRIKAGATVKEITLELQAKECTAEAARQLGGNSIDWLLKGILIEDDQIRLRQLQRRIGSHSSTDQKLELDRKRQRISCRIRDFHETSMRLLGTDQVLQRIGKPDSFDRDGYVSDDLRDPTRTERHPDLEAPENVALIFPSSLSGQQTAECNALRDRELILRRARANDAIQSLRETLSGLSYQYINKVRQSSSTREHTRAFQGIKIMTMEASFHRQVYNRCRRAILLADAGLASRYPFLRADECNISTAVADVNAAGQSQSRLAWFWGATDGYIEGEAQKIGTDSSRLLECYRVNWLRARAQKDRAEEELPRTKREMLWVVLYFMNRRDSWYRHMIKAQAEPDCCLGQVAYCEKQIHRWDEFARVADLQFRKVNSEFPSTWLPLNIRLFS